jgi:hypothetical protein
VGISMDDMDSVTFPQFEDLPDGNGIINFGSRKEPEEEE